VKLFNFYAFYVLNIECAYISENYSPVTQVNTNPRQRQRDVGQVLGFLLNSPEGEK
jgi:hypothetical protein